jgi:hypothetical protein
MNEDQQIRDAKTPYKVVLWLAAGIIIGAILWMPLFQSLIAAQ